MIPSPAAMLKNLEQRAASNFLMENLLQSKSPGSEFSLTLNWAAAATLMARQREKDASNSIVLPLKKLHRNINVDNNTDDDNNVPMRIDGEFETETETETDGEIAPGYRERLTKIRIESIRSNDDNNKIIHTNDDDRLDDYDNDIKSHQCVSWHGQYSIGKTEDRLIANDETCSQNYGDEQCQRETSPSHSFTSSSNTTESRGIQTKEKPELKFGVKAILADDYERRRNSENLQSLQIYKPTGYSLQTSPTLQSGYPSSLAKPIARPAAYHPHHPPHPSHPPGPPAQHHFPSHPHHTLQLLACQGPYITVSNPATGGSQLIAGTASSFPPGMQPAMSDLANININHPCFPWAQTTRGRPRKGMMRRAVFSDTQRRGLEKRFLLQKYISKPDRKKLAEKLGLKDSQVKIWFQNRRMKWRNTKERELMVKGGSREQTLPNKNNPNPDLSDTDFERRGDLIHEYNNSPPLNSPPRTPLKIEEIRSDNEENEEINVT